MIAATDQPESVDEMFERIELATGLDCFELFTYLADESSGLYDKNSFWAGLVVGGFFVAVQQGK